jgi:hypothetical protein
MIADPSGSPTLADVRSLLERDGRHPVLLYIPANTKGPKIPGWQQLTYEQTLEPEYQRRLESYPNTGVQLGLNGAPVTIDLDTEAGHVTFLNDNPPFSQTLCTAGGPEGSQFWFYAIGDRPHKVCRISCKANSPLAVGARNDPDENGLVTIGEFRAEGGQSVIRGLHTSESYYRWRQAFPPFQFNLKDIVWHSDFVLSWLDPPPTPVHKETPHQHDTAAGQELLQRAVAKLTIDVLWSHFGYPERRGNPVKSPFFPDDKDKSFSVSPDGATFFDHDPGRTTHRGGSYRFFQIAKGLDSKSAFIPFIEFAGFADELYVNKKAAVLAELEKLGIAPSTAREIWRDMDQIGTKADVVQRARDSTLGQVFEENGDGANEVKPQRSSPEELAAATKAQFERYLQDRSVLPPSIRPEALHGIAGRIVRLMARHCEASYESLLFQFLVAVGNIMGRCVYVYAGGPWLFTNEFTICVGATARGRKGTAWRLIEQLFSLVSRDWLNNCTDTDVQTGEGIVFRVRDPVRGIPKQDRRKKKSDEPPPEEVVLDKGVEDKRLQIIEEEISNVLKMARRQGNTLTETYRKGWDSPRSLRTSNKNSPLIATEPHISLIGHTNKNELLETLNDIELSNGFANRILWCASQRRELMPDADYLDWKEQKTLPLELQSVFLQYPANSDDIDGPIRFKRTAAANELWKTLYRKLNDQKHVSFIDGVLVRDTSHLLKLALIYAVLDKRTEIDVVHMEAALAVCDYSQATARWLFADRTGNRLGNTIHWALLRAPEGISRTDISVDVCYRNTPKIQLDQALEALAKNGMARMEIREGENGRRTEFWFPVT